MTDYEVVVTILVAVIGSASLWQFVMYMIDRFDKKKKSNEDIVIEIEKVSTKVDELTETVDKNQAVLARTHILRFSDELKNGVEHSEEYFRQQLDDCDVYEKFCETHPEFKNSYTEIANRHIKETYERLLKEGKL